MTNTLWQPKSNKYFNNSQIRILKEKKKGYGWWEFITTKVFLNFLFRWTGSYQSYRGTMRKNEEHRTPFYFLFVVFILLFTVQREKKEVPIFNKILPWSSHIFRAYRLFYCFIILEIFISGMLYWLLSYHGSRVQNRWGTPFRNPKK